MAHLKMTDEELTNHLSKELQEITEYDDKEEVKDFIHGMGFEPMRLVYRNDPSLCIEASRAGNT